MEAKTLLRLIKEDITHLEGITDDFILESLPSSDVVELARVRAAALLKELELLHKVAVQQESIAAAIKLADEPNDEIQEPNHSEQTHFEPFDGENTDNEEEKILIPDQEEVVPETEIHDTILNIEDQHPSEELPADIIDVSPDEEHFTALVEPVAEPDDFVPESPIIIEEAGDESETAEDETNEVIADNHEEQVENKEEALIDQEDTVAEPSAIIEAEDVTNIPGQQEEIPAEAFKEVKKILNETLGEPHQTVNDILSPEQEEPGFQIIPIDSIWDGIGINDRFLFIRELFANSSAKLENTVTALDKLATIQEAVAYLKMNFKWNKTEASQKFLVLVKRRFIK